MIIRFKQESPTLYSASWNGRKITVEGADGWGPWTLKVNGLPIPCNGRMTVTNPTEAFRAIERAAQNIIIANAKRGVIAKQRVSA